MGAGHGGGNAAPTPRPNALFTHVNAFGWEGLDHTDQRSAGNGNQFSLEPPDQALCVGGVSPNGPADGVEVVESVNDALAFYDSTSHQFGVPLTLSEFFGLPPTIDRNSGTYGPFESDPKCYFDTATQRWFVTMLVINQDPVTGDLIAPATTYIAVSTSSEALGSYFVYTLDATDTDHAGCPCFGDQPLIGADQYGFYVNTSEYSLDCFTGGACAFNGPQLYAMDKVAMESGLAVDAVHFDGLTHVDGGRTTGTIQPSTTPNGVFETAGRRHGVPAVELRLSAGAGVPDRQRQVQRADDLGDHEHEQPADVDARSAPVPQGHLERDLGNAGGHAAATRTPTAR